jgi:N6-L-threonylcarbamoyladenine synthase
VSTIKLLAIESSCDETSAAVLHNTQVLSNITYTQAVHEQYGGVIPEAASRLHIKNILPVVDSALKKANTKLDELDAIAYTQSPGLIGSLLVGVHFAKGLSQVLDIPTIAVQHLHAHVLSNLIKEPRPPFPFLCLTVSGGHTQLIICKSPTDLALIGQTQDDAAGEAFDKTAKLLGLDYPGGPFMDKYAREGNSSAFQFSKPQVDGLDFSFSGLKTSVLYFLQKEMRKDKNFITDNRNDLCASIQHTIISILMEKLILAVEQTGITHVCIAGGVSANSGLRKALQSEGEKRNWTTYIPDFEYCTDNAAMIGITGYYKYLEKDFASLELAAEARSSF